MNTQLNSTPYLESTGQVKTRNTISSLITANADGQTRNVYKPHVLHSSAEV